MKRTLAVGLFALLLAAPGASAPATFLRGIDVSHWTGSIRWASVARGGYRFAFAEATNGAASDPTYEQNRAGAAAAGIAFGAFHLAHPYGRTPAAVAASAVAEADHFLAVAQPQTGDLVPVLDLEYTGGLTPAALAAWTSAWLGEVQQALGMRPTIYASTNFWRHAMRDSSAFARAGSRLWVAQWLRRGGPSVPAGNWASTGWTFWQWTDCSHVPGIRGCVDGDRYRGASIARVVMPPEPVPTEPPSLAGLPLAGQTLTASPGTWLATPPPSFTYAWLRCDASAQVCKKIPGAAASTYLLGVSDRGSTIEVVVSATSNGRSAEATSAPTGIVQ